MIGRKFGKWTVLYESGRKGKHLLVMAKCECGIQKRIRVDGLLAGLTTQCINCRKESKHLQMIGNKFGCWTVLQEVPMAEKRKHYEVQCDCGFKRILKGIRLRFGDSIKCRSCASTKHNLVHTKTYATWEGIIQRCTNPKNRNFKYYGERGIKVCDRWLKFENFLEDMDLRLNKLELDRIDNNGNYEPSNCRWTTRSENLKNRRSHNLKLLNKGASEISSA